MFDFFKKIYCAPNMPLLLAAHEKAQPVAGALMQAGAAASVAAAEPAVADLKCPANPESSTLDF
jgi:hypothetical protein